MPETELPSSREAIARGSKSFSLASLLFDPETRASCHHLYAWCRHCDDRIDESPSPAEGRARLEALREQTGRALMGFVDCGPPAMENAAAVFNRYRIPHAYAFDLLDGMSMDVQGMRYTDFDHLRIYCYRVAGVVGLMMTSIMGTSDPRALKNAVDLGVAMQLTNIARDVFDDFSLGRVYLPEDWMREEELDPAKLTEPSQRAALARVVDRLLTKADELYGSGFEGLRYLPLRSALAVAAAGEIYSRIGLEVRAKGNRAWDARAYVPIATKLACVALAALRVLRLLPSRARHPWQRAKIDTMWSYS